jgi:hypothetical protein
VGSRPSRVYMAAQDIIRGMASFGPVTVETLESVCVGVALHWKLCLASWVHAGFNWLLMSTLDAPLVHHR